MAAQSMSSKCTHCFLFPQQHLVLKSILWCSIPTEAPLNSMYGTQLARRSLVACVMATTSKVRSPRAQSLILLMLAMLEAASVAAVMSWHRCLQILYVERKMFFARQCVLMWEHDKLCFRVLLWALVLMELGHL